MTWAQRFFTQVLTYGEIPQHVAFTMDGNYGEKNCISEQESYAKG